MSSIFGTQHIIAADVGTQCDNRLMTDAIKHLVSRGHIINYLTNPSNEVSIDGVRRIYYEEPQPDFFVQNSDLLPADPSANVVWWAITHPLDAYKSVQWYTKVAKKLTSLCKRALGRGVPRISLLLWYPLLSVLWRFDPNFFELIASKNKVDVYILYCAPGLPSEGTPWLFDSVLKSPGFRGLWSKSISSREHNLSSGIAFLERAASGTSLSYTIDEVMYKVTHVLMINRYVLPPTSILRFRYPVVWWPEGLISPPVKHVIPLDLELFLRVNNGRIIYVTFGSYANAIAPFIEGFLVRLVEFCRKTNHVAFVHNVPGIAPSPIIRVQEGYVPYESIVPHSALVVFTGSVCLQTVCHHNSTPMLFVPVLAEQFFWARNYKYHTDVPFLRATRDGVPRYVPFAKAIRAPRVRRYLSRIKANIGRSQQKELGI